MLGKDPSSHDTTKFVQWRKCEVHQEIGHVQHNRPGDLKHVFWSCVLKMCRGNAQGKFK